MNSEEKIFSTIISGLSAGMSKTEIVGLNNSITLTQQGLKNFFSNFLMKIGFVTHR